MNLLPSLTTEPCVATGADGVAGFARGLRVLGLFFY
jgi:hypothetical protein